MGVVWSPSTPPITPPPAAKTALEGCVPQALAHKRRVGNRAGAAGYAAAFQSVARAIGGQSAAPAGTPRPAGAGEWVSQITEEGAWAIFLRGCLH